MENIDASFQKELFNDLFPTLHSNLYILPGLKEYRDKHSIGDIVFDYRISFQLTKELKASVVINNLLNHEYMCRPGDVQPTSNFWLVLSARHDVAVEQARSGRGSNHLSEGTANFSIGP